MYEKGTSDASSAAVGLQVGNVVDPVNGKAIDRAAALLHESA